MALATPEVKTVSIEHLIYLHNLFVREQEWAHRCELRNAGLGLVAARYAGEAKAYQAALAAVDATLQGIRTAFADLALDGIEQYQAESR